MLNRPRVQSSAEKEEQKHLDDLLEEALEETFPASDPLAMLELAPNSHRAKKSKTAAPRKKSHEGRRGRRK